MARWGFPKTELFLESNNNFVSCSQDEKIGNLMNLIRNSFEPILVFNGDEFMGLISVQNVIYGSKLPYLSKAENKIVSASKIKTSTNILKALKQMADYGWYRVPVFNNKNEMVGQITLKKVLKIMMENDLFRRLLILKTKIRKPILLSNKAKIKSALEILKDKDNSYGFLMNDEGQYVGAVSKDSFIKAFNKKVEISSQTIRFGPNNSHIYVGEKIDRDDYLLNRFVKRRLYWSTAKETDKKKNIIKKLINSRFNTIVILDQRGAPSGVLETKDLLESVLVKDKTGGMPLKLDGFENLNNLEMNSVIKIIQRLFDYLNKKNKVNKIELVNKEVKSISGKVKAYETRIKVSMYSGKICLGHDKSKDIFKGVKELVKEIKIQAAKI